MLGYATQTLLQRLHATSAELTLAGSGYAVSDYDLAPLDVEQFLASTNYNNHNNNNAAAAAAALGTTATAAALFYSNYDEQLLSSSSAGGTGSSSSGSTTTTTTTTSADIETINPAYFDYNTTNYSYENFYETTTRTYATATATATATTTKLYDFIETDNNNWTHTCFEEYNPDGNDNHFEFWICGIMLNIVGILGILGNVISMIILSRPQMRSSINYLLIGLARCDTLLIITSMLIFGIPSIYPYSGYFFDYYNYVYPFISPAIFPIGMIAQTSSVYMTFTVTLERYVAVCHPLRARALCTYGRAKIYFIVCILFSLAYNMPRFLEVVTVSTKLTEKDIMLHCVRPSLLRRNPEYISIYIHWCYLLVNYIIPFSTLAILNCLIYRQVKRANRERQRLSRSEKREIGLATMLLCVVFVFFLFNFLALVLNINEAFYNYIDNKLTKVSNMLITINSSVNFLIYIIFGEKFKRIFLLIFFKRRLSRDQPDLIHYESSISNNGDGITHRGSSGRFSRHGTQRSTTTYLVATQAGNGSTLRLTQIGGGGGCSPGLVQIKRNRAPSPGPIVYYPARELQRSASSTTPALMTTTNMSMMNNNTALGYDWSVAATGGMKTTLLDLDGNLSSNGGSSGGGGKKSTLTTTTMTTAAAMPAATTTSLTMATATATGQITSGF